MALLDKILGRPLSSKEKKKQELSLLTGVPALGLDALASTAYGPEAALMILLPLGQAGLQYFWPIILAIVAVLLILYFSYLQTMAAYPGGGAYVVASANMGRRVGVWAGISLLLDYFLNVAVGISAGIGAVVSAFPALQPYTLTLCLLVLFILTMINLRGVRESGLVFIFPTVAFVVCIGIAILIGFFHSWQNAGHPQALKSFASLSTAHVSLWLLLGAFANGLTAMTGVEAVSNAVPLFRKPRVQNAQWTLTVIVGLLAIMLLCLGYLCPAYGVVAMDQSQPGYKTILSQLIAATAGKGFFYYFSNLSIFIVLTYSAQTSFAGFPRVCRLLAEDNFLPDFFAERGRRLVFSYGIIILAFFSALLLIAFKGITYHLIPLFAVGAFSAFLFSQSGMVLHWLRKKPSDRPWIKLIANAVGACVTSLALVIIVAEKFIEGAWLIVLIAPLLFILLTWIQRHYQQVAREINRPLKLQVSKLKAPIVLIPIRGWDCAAEKAVRFGLLLSDDITAINISIDKKEEAQRLETIWSEKVEKPLKALHSPVPTLKIIYSPYRKIYKPIMDFVKKTKKKAPDRLIAIVIPELIEPHWYEYLLHNLHAARLRALLFLERDQRTIVITTPWYLDEI